ncbi:hypothetical protein K2173_020154 [Erythroxylum novogranatense]|uniref:RING-type E3 ubiquitin transferase n=1 Tax=Erythroxylum novogranatense TaxID=1862640 RepID=A0AAV8U796_9ROSI|nr:hypothetical protein K2173_020154 [Erythroxylum novogranatense]
MSGKIFGVQSEIMVTTIVILLILLFMGIGVLIILVHVCIMGRALRQRIANNIATERENIDRSSMSIDDVEKLPSYHYARNESGSSPVICAVCLDNFEDGDRCRLLPLCKHSFHAQCVDAWLLKTPICPICRTCTDLRRVGMITGEELSSHFGDTSMDTRGSLTTESSHYSDFSVEVREGMPRGSRHFMNSDRCFTRENKATQSRDVTVDSRQNEGETSHVNVDGIDLIQTSNQPNTVGIEHITR